MQSVYYWENAIQVDSERLLLIKTLTQKFNELKAFIKANHSYDTPEIIALEANAVEETYFNWIKKYLES